MECSAADCLAGDHPIERNEWVVACDASSVGACSYWNAEFQHPPNRRRPLRRLLAIAVQKILALKSHAVLDGNAAAQCFDAFKAAVEDGFAMIEEPVCSLERNFTIDRFK